MAATTSVITTPGNAVFQITELLEQILEHLSWTYLFPSKRLCRRFNELIINSKLLRQKTTLFRPEPETSLSNDEPLRRIGHEMLNILLGTGIR